MRLSQLREKIADSPQFCDIYLMSKPQFILAATLVGSGLAFAGPIDKNVITPEAVCGPWYISAYGGGSFFDSADFTGTDYAFGPNSAGHIRTWDLNDPNPPFNDFPNTATPGNRYYPDREIGKTTGKLNMDYGWIVGGAVGFRTQRQWRFELDINHTQSPFDNGTLVSGGANFYDPDYQPATDGNGNPTPPGDAGVSSVSGRMYGNVQRSSLFINAVKEFGQNRVHPYVGAGLGLTNANVGGTLLFGHPNDFDDAHQSFSDETFVRRYNAEQVVLGYQMMAGLAYDFTDCIQAYGEYRLMGQGEISDVGTFSDLYGSLDLGWAQHIILGVRYFF